MFLEHGELQKLHINDIHLGGVVHKKVLKELDKENGLDQLFKTSFICDIIYYRNREIDCGFKLDGTKNIKTFDYKETLDYLLYEKRWLKDI